MNKDIIEIYFDKMNDKIDKLSDTVDTISDRLEVLEKDLENRALTKRLLTFMMYLYPLLTTGMLFMSNMDHDKMIDAVSKANTVISAVSH